MLHPFRATKDNPVWDHFLSLSHSQSALIAYRKDENNNQQYVGLIFRLIKGYGASAVPPSCFGGCIHAQKRAMCAMEQKLFTTAAEGIEWVMRKADFKGPLPTDLKEPDCISMHDKSKSATNGFWNDRHIYFSTPVADQKRVEPPYGGKENVRQAPQPKAKPSFEPYRPKRNTREPRPVHRTEPVKAAAMPVIAPRKDISIEEHLEAAIKDVKEAFAMPEDDQS